MVQFLSRHGSTAGPADPDRRRFLFGATALALSAPQLAQARAPLGDCTWCAPSDAAWRSLSELTQGRLLRAGDTGFAERALPQNLRYRRVQPQAIARCASPEIVAKVLGWCRDLDIPFAIRGGGHSYAGHSTTTGVLVDLSPMKRVAFDGNTGRITIGAGALNADVADALSAAGRTITHGRCPSVGIAGFLLGGGIGFNMRRYGIGSDRMSGAELVTADGAVRAVSGQSEPELFWALRGGGGGNMGVSTSFTLDTAAQDERITVFSIRWKSRIEPVLAALVPILETAPAALGSRFSLGAVTPAGAAGRAEVHLDLLGQFAGSRADFLALLAPAFASAAPERAVVEERGYWEAQNFLAEPGEPGFYQERSGFVKPVLTEAMLERALRWLRIWPGTESVADIRFFQTGAAVNALAPDATAFVHRDSAWLFSIGLDWSAADQVSPAVMREARRWQDGFYAAMREHCGIAAYQNFPDPSLVDWRQAYYGANLPKLQRIKAAVDPSNLFRHEQSL